MHRWLRPYYSVHASSERSLANGSLCRASVASSDNQGASSGGDEGDEDASDASQASVCKCRCSVRCAARVWMRVIGAAEIPILCLVVPVLVLTTVVVAAVSISSAQKDADWVHILIPAEIALACVAFICVSLVATRLYFRPLYAQLGGAIVTLCCNPWLSAAVPASMGGILITMLLVTLSVCLLNVKLAGSAFLPWSVVVLPLIFVIAQMFLSPPCSFPGSGERGRELPPPPFVINASPLRELAISHSQISLSYLMPMLLSLLMLSARLMGSFSFDAHFIMSPLYVSLIVFMTRCVRIVGSRPASRFPPLHLAGAIALIAASAMLFLLLLLMGEYDRTGASTLPLVTLLPITVLFAPFIVYAVARSVQKYFGSAPVPECFQRLADAVEQPGSASRDHMVIPIAPASALALRDSPRSNSAWYRRSPRGELGEPVLPNSGAASASALAASGRFSQSLRSSGGSAASRNHPRSAASAIEDAAQPPFARPRGLSSSPRRVSPRFSRSVPLLFAAPPPSSLSPPSHAALLAPPLHSHSMASPSRSPRISPRRAHAMAASVASSESALAESSSLLSPPRESRWAVSRHSSPRLSSGRAAAGAAPAASARSPRSSFAAIVPQSAAHSPRANH